MSMSKTQEMLVSAPAGFHKGQGITARSDYYHQLNKPTFLSDSSRIKREEEQDYHFLGEGSMIPTIEKVERLVMSSSSISFNLDGQPSNSKDTKVKKRLKRKGPSRSSPKKDGPVRNTTTTNNDSTDEPTDINRGRSLIRKTSKRNHKPRRSERKSPRLILHGPKHPKTRVVKILFKGRLLRVVDMEIPEY